MKTIELRMMKILCNQHTNQNLVSLIKIITMKNATNDDDEHPQSNVHEQYENNEENGPQDFVKLGAMVVNVCQFLSNKMFPQIKEEFIH